MDGTDGAYYAGTYFSGDQDWLKVGGNRICFCPSRNTCKHVSRRYAEGNSFDGFDSTIRDLMLAGF